MMRRLWLSLIVCVAWASQLLAQNTALPTFDVRRYGAKGDGTTDDTAAINAAVDAAEAYQAANSEPAMVQFPRGTYIVQDSSTGIDTTPCIEISSTARDIVLIGYDATLKIGTNGVQTSAIRVVGSRCRVVGLTIDANAANAPLDTNTADAFDTKSNTAFEINGSGAEGIEGTDCVIQDCKVINADKGLTTYTTGTIEYDHTGGASERLVTLTGGSFPAWVDTESAITISGTRYPVESVLSTTTLTLSASTNTAVNNPGADVAAGAAYTVSAYAKVNQGEEAFVMVHATRSKFVNCHSFDSSWQAFRVQGNQNQVIGCSAYNHLGNGLRILGCDELHVIGFNSISNRNDGRHGIIADAGSSEDDGSIADGDLTDVLDDSDVRSKHLYISDSYLESNTDGDFDGACSVLKLAACYEAHVSKCTIIAGNATNNIAVRIEDSLRLVTLDKCYIEPNILFTPASTSGSVYQGTISNHADAGGSLAGYVRYTVTGGTGLVNGKTLFVRGSGIDQYNGPQQVLEASSGSIVTDRPFVSGSIGSSTYGQSCCDTFKMRDCVLNGIGLSAVGSGAHGHYNYWIDNCIAYNVDIENCKFRMKDRVNVKQGGIFTDYDSERALTLFRLVRNEFNWNSDKLCRAVRGSVAEMATSGRIIAHSNTLSNRHTGTVKLNNTYEATDTTEDYIDRSILFSSDGEKPGLYAYTGPPTSASFTWQTGDYIRNSEPSSGEPSGWYCIAGGTPGTWRAVPFDQPLAGIITEVGNVGSGEDNLITYTVPANTLARDGDTIEIEAGFTFAANANLKHTKLYFGSDVIYSSTDAAQNGGSVAVRATIVYGDAIVGKWSTHANVTASGAYTNLGAAGTLVIAAGSPIEIKGTGEADSDNDIVMQYLRVQLHRAP